MNTSKLQPKDLKIGMIIIPVTNTNSHNYKLGHRYKIVNINADRCGFIAECLQTGKCGNMLVPYDCTFVCISKADMQNEIDVLEEQIATKNAEIKFIAQRINWMNDTGVSEFNEDEYQIYSVIENTMGKDMIVSANKMAEMVSRLRSNREGFMIGDTVGFGKRRLWVIGINTITEAILSDGTVGSNIVIQKSHILESIKKVLIEKTQTFFNYNYVINVNGLVEPGHYNYDDRQIGQIRATTGYVDGGYRIIR